MRQRAKLNEDGFTLLELLIAAFLSAVLLAALYGAFFSILGGREVANEELTRAREARRFIDIFTMEVEAAHFIKGDAKTLFNSGDGSLEFTHFSYPLLVESKPSGDLKRVKYYFKAGGAGIAGAGGALYKESTDALAVSALSAYAVEAIRGVHAVKFAFFDGMEWQPEWDAGATGFMPLGVKVELFFDGADEPLYSSIARPRIR